MKTPEMRSHRYIVKCKDDKLNKIFMLLKAIKFTEMQSTNIFSMEFYMHKELLSYLEDPKKFPETYLVAFLDGEGHEIGYIKVLDVKDGVPSWNSTKFDYAITEVQTVIVNFTYLKTEVCNKPCDS